MEKNYYNGEDCLRFIECVIDVFKINGFNGFCIGNIIKYIYRYPKKNGKEDLKKAKDYINLLFYGNAKICEDNEIKKLEYIKEQIDKRYSEYFLTYNQRKLLKYFMETLIYRGDNKKHYDSLLKLYTLFDSLINEKEI